MTLHIDIEKKLGTFSLQVKADVSGERTGIFGESGSGKSTLMHLVSGLMQPDKGEIILDDVLQRAGLREQGVGRLRPCHPARRSH